MAVLACVKVRNLKANHNYRYCAKYNLTAVLVCVKVRNLKANHNDEHGQLQLSARCISICEGTESES